MDSNTCLHWDPFVESKIVRELLLASNDNTVSEESTLMVDGSRDSSEYCGWSKKKNLNSDYPSTGSSIKISSRFVSIHRNLKSQKTSLTLPRTSWKEPQRCSLDGRHKFELLFPWRGVLESGSYRYLPNNGAYQRWKMKINFPSYSIQSASFFSNGLLTTGDTLLSTRSVTSNKKNSSLSNNETRDNPPPNLLKPMEQNSEKADTGGGQFSFKSTVRHNTLALPQLSYGRSLTNIYDRQIHFDGVEFNRQSTILRVAKRNEALNGKMKLAPIHDTAAYPNSNDIMFSATSTSSSETLDAGNEQVVSHSKRFSNPSTTNEPYFTDRSNKSQNITLKPLFHCCSVTCLCRNNADVSHHKDSNDLFTTQTEMNTGFGEDTLISKSDYSSYIYKAFHSNSLGQRKDRRLFTKLNPTEALSVQKCSVMLAGVGLK